MVTNCGAMDNDQVKYDSRVHGCGRGCYGRSLDVDEWSDIDCWISGHLPR